MHVGLRIAGQLCGTRGARGVGRVDRAEVSVHRRIFAATLLSVLSTYHRVVGVILIDERSQETDGSYSGPIQSRRVPQFATSLVQLSCSLQRTGITTLQQPRHLAYSPLTSFCRETICLLSAPLNTTKRGCWVRGKRMVATETAGNGRQQ